MDTLSALWAFHKENIILTAVAALVFAVVYEVAAHYVRKFFSK